MSALPDTPGAALALVRSGYIQQLQAELRAARDKARRLERQNYWFRLNSGLMPRKPRQVTTKDTKHTKAAGGDQS